MQNNYLHLRYSFTSSNHSVSILQYADDTCLVANSLENLQTMCNATSRWIRWARMSIKVPKCRILSVHRGLATKTPTILLGSEKVPPIISGQFKFLGMPVYIASDTHEHRKFIFEHLNDLLLKVNKSLVSRQQKLMLYRVAICSRISYSLSLFPLPLSWIERTLDTLATKYLKKWAGLARSANPGRLYLTTPAGGLDIKKPSMIYKSLQLSRQIQLICSRDPCMRYLSTKQITHEESMASGYNPATTVRDILTEEPDANRQKLKRMVALRYKAESDIELRENLKIFASSR